ncbi:MAG: sigma-70 family RNA polymerase sigma factor [Myxococcales bacterium]|nr:sigma-70 family RNA polymerase sigma factor [Myxococcales bacterium]
MTDPAASGHKSGVLLAMQGVPSGSDFDSEASSDAVGVVPSIPQFREIYDQYFDFVYRGARRLGIHSRALDDATQDVFLVVHRRLDDFEGRSCIKTWLYGITRRVAKDYRRRASRKEKGLVSTTGPIGGQLAAAQNSPDENAARREAAQTLEKILAGLDEARREVFVLAEMEQMTAPEIAEALSLNLNTTYSRLRTARTEFEKAVSRHLASMETLP